MKPTVAIVRGAFLNQYEMQLFEPLQQQYAITGFSSLFPFHTAYSFPVTRLVSPMDLPEFPYKMPILNRLFVDAHYLLGLEHRLQGFDLVHTAETYYHYTRQSLQAKQKGYVGKVIATVLENIPFNNESIPGRSAFKAYTRTELDHIIALTQKTKDALILEGADAAKISVIGHAINTDVFQPRKNFVQRHAGKLRKVTILFTGRLEQNKGVYEVLFALKKLASDQDLANVTLRCVFVGHGSAYDGMRKLEQRLNIARLVTYKQVAYERMPAEYQAADIFVAPSKPTQSWQEQYCTALLEAQAAGLPIVTTQTGGIPENVGSAAVLVPPADYQALAAALKTFIVYPNKRARYAKKARQRAVRVHDVRVVGKKVSGVYQQVLES